MTNDRCLTKQTCKCLWFADRSRQASPTPQRLGRVGHLVRVVVLPADSQGAAFRPECLFSDMA